MEKLGFMIMALALVLTFSQCKKNDTPTNEGEKVFVRVNVSTGAKQEVNPETGIVTFATSDVIHVACNGVYLGTLSYNGTQFTGEINTPTEGQKLQFYFLGNETPEFNSDNTECSVSISDQTTKLPLISAAPSIEDYSAGLTEYNATLLNQCALVKFNVTTSSNAATCVKGFNNKVTVSFSENAFTYTQESEGVITLPAGNGSQWAILLPQPAMEAGALESAYSEDEGYAGTRGAVPTIYENGYFTIGIPVEVTTKMIPKGAIDGLFTINANGQQVYFSRGNLQYIGSAATPYWKFAEYQWTYLDRSTGQNSNSTTADRDLFGWGTSGYNHGAVQYQPWSITQTYSHYYAYGSASYNLYDGDGKADWGYNAIVNGGNKENNGWRTMTKDEWRYVFLTRVASTVNGTANARYAKAKVSGMQGVILFPDVYTHPDGVVQPVGINVTGATGWDGNNFTSTDFALMEANGAVFLPAAGYRSAATIYYPNEVGSYWASSCYDNENVYRFNFRRYENDTQSCFSRCFGHAVRLVRNAQ